MLPKLFLSVFNRKQGKCVKMEMDSEVKPQPTLFLPESLVSLILKIGKKFEINNYNIFSILVFSIKKLT